MLATSFQLITRLRPDCFTFCNTWCFDSSSIIAHPVYSGRDRQNVMPRIRHLLANIYTYIYIDIDITLSISDMDFLYQFNLSLHHFWGLFFSMLKKKIFQKLAGLWLVGKVVNHVGLYGSKVAEGCSAFQRRSCLLVKYKRMPVNVSCC